MSTAPSTTPAGWDTVTLTVHDRPLTVPAEPAAPGLAVVPSVTGTGWSGGYAVVHTASGKHIGPYRLPLAYARELAHRLATGADWTRPADHVRADTALRRHTAGILCDLGEARDLGLPLWWARPSWRRVAPPWLITSPTATTGDGPWVADTWAHVVRFADQAARDGWTPVPDDAVVRRAEHPEWELVCGAPGCGRGRGTTPGTPDRPPAVLTDWDDEIGDDRPLRRTTRADLVAHARAEHWREHTNPRGRYWLCPTCVDDHPRDRD